MRVTAHKRRVPAAVAAAALAAGLIAVVAAPAATTSSAAVVSVTLKEWKLVPGQLSARAGRISFLVRNDGTMAHEFVVLRSDRHHHSLPVKGGKAVETGRLARIPVIATGASKRITLRVPRGRYILLCNMLGHYQAGQYAAMRVL